MNTLSTRIPAELVDAGAQRSPRNFGATIRRVLDDRDSFSSFCHMVLVLYCLSAPFSIAVAQTLLLSLLATWLVATFRSIRRGDSVALTLLRNPKQIDNEMLRDPQFLRIGLFMAAFFVVAVIAGITGIRPGRGVPDALKTFIYLLLPFCVLTAAMASRVTAAVWLSRLKIYFFALTFSQSLAAVHTMIEAWVGHDVSPRIPGPVTESGQLVLSIPCLIGLGLFAYGQSLRQGGGKDENNPDMFVDSAVRAVHAFTLFLSLLIIAWPQIFHGSAGTFGDIDFDLRLFGLIAAALLAIAPVAIHLFREQFRRRAILSNTYWMIWPVGALLFAALVVNLKRGPWVAVMLELIVLGLFVSKRIALTTLLVGVLLVVGLSPTRNRLSHMADDFSIAGGRQSMWGLGAELAQRYPLGLGLQNASYMQQLDPLIPARHGHMHNNLLNVVVECGWLGLLAYVAWMVAIIVFGVQIWRECHASSFRVRRQLGFSALILSCALLGWQTAGIVEYNFGDGEIRLIALLFMGLLFGTRIALSKNGYTNDPLPES